MFHTYIITSSGNEVDFDRASFLMDRDLLAEALHAMRHERDAALRDDTESRAQWAWDHYCDLHFEKYGEDFLPDVSPNWDRENEPEPAPVDLGPKPEELVRLIDAPPGVVRGRPLSSRRPTMREARPVYPAILLLTGRKPPP